MQASPCAQAVQRLTMNVRCSSVLALPIGDSGGDLVAAISGMNYAEAEDPFEQLAAAEAKRERGTDARQYRTELAEETQKHICMLTAAIFTFDSCSELL